MSFRLQYIRPENRGVLGFLKHTARRATSKEYWPLSLGFLIATAAFMSVPVTEETRKQSLYANREEIMRQRAEKGGGHH